ncbi:rubrerythrin family protein [Botryobacter ruber]|uniref:rubrerythrin family protein n=1 Tax=Botryobacter ruber TaxID=2171629 RepID=UPI0013E38B43|nr:rubrerythrin family protein [Botryobacter ruber]
MKAIFIIPFLLLCSLVTYGQQHKQTLTNLEKAYQAEANASRRYEMFSKKASEEKQEQIARLFRAVSKSESIHMQNHKRAIEKIGGTPSKIMYQKVKVETTRDNLKEPIEGEKQETESLYPEFVRIAKQENAKQAVQSFTYAMEAEAQHEKLYKDALQHYGRNKKMDYYVSSVSGSTIAVEPGKPAPKPKHPNEKYMLIK